MSTLLLAWELGAGLGHMMPMGALGSRVSKAGHRVVAVLRDLTDAHHAFDGAGVELLQAPFKQRLTSDAIEPIGCFAHILWNTGFNNAEGLAVLAEAWRALFEAVRPDVILFDHSPTALLASRGLQLRRALIGTGFAHPSLTRPLPTLRPWLHVDPARVEADEERVLVNANKVLLKLKQPAMNQLADLYQPIEESFLFTLEALDPYAPRTQGNYFHVASKSAGKPPQWPPVPGPRIFAYLKPFRALGALLAALRETRQPVIVYAPEVDPKLKSRVQCETLSFSTEPLNLQTVATECDAAILNGTNATIIQMLLAGKPTLQIPLVLEQVLNAKAVARLGAGVCAPPDNPDEVRLRLRELLDNSQLAVRARQFAASQSRLRSIDDLAGTVCQLLDHARIPSTR